MEELLVNTYLRVSKGSERHILEDELPASIGYWYTYKGDGYMLLTLEEESVDDIDVNSFMKFKDLKDRKTVWATKGNHIQICGGKSVDVTIYKIDTKAFMLLYDGKTLGEAIKEAKELNC